MSGFDELFDIQKLDDRQLGQIEYVLMSPAYVEAFEPYLKSIRETLAQRLLDPSKDRKEVHSDDFLRGGIVAIDGLLTFFKLIIAQTQMERVDRAMSPKSPEQEYDAERQRGGHVPILGANEPFEGTMYDPAEDF
jgi:hypothetical protein